MENMATLAPIPSASDSMATVETSGVARSAESVAEVGHRYSGPGQGCDRPPGQMVSQGAWGLGRGAWSLKLRLEPRASHVVNP
jgi:hypothetical protein